MASRRCASQAQLSLIYAAGDGVEQDFEQAYHWLSLAANQGDALAQRNLGVMYAQGDYVTQDYTRAVCWYTLATNQGSIAAQYQLGVMYTKGAGVPQDYRQSFIWSLIAADNGDEGAPLYRDYAARIALFGGRRGTRSPRQGWHAGGGP